MFYQVTAKVPFSEKCRISAKAASRTPQKGSKTVASTATTNLTVLTRLFAAAASARYLGPSHDSPIAFQMLTSSPSPALNPRSPRDVHGRSPRNGKSLLSAAAGRRRSAPSTPLETSARQSNSPQAQQSRLMSDAGTQCTPPTMPQSPERPSPHRIRWEQAVAAATAPLPESPEPRMTPEVRSSVSSLHSFDPAKQSSSSMKAPSTGRLSTYSTGASTTSYPPSSSAGTTTLVPTTASSSTAFSAHTVASSISTTASSPATGTSQTSKDLTNSSSSHPTRSSKRLRPSPTSKSIKIVPQRYQSCDPSVLVSLISSMLMDLISHNDSNTLSNSGLTRFHSRAPPGISVHDYLQRLTTHATLSPPILLCMVYYIDRLCALWPRFTINSLTVHRYLIASATVASKGLSDSFWTNNTYARVGGVGLRELAILELEFLQRIEWRIVPKPEVLVDYYQSLVERGEGVEMEGERVPRGLAVDKGVQGGPMEEGQEVASLVTGSGMSDISRGKMKDERSSSQGSKSSRSEGSVSGSKAGSDRMETESELSSGEIIAQEDAKRRAAAGWSSAPPSGEQTRESPVAGGALANG